MTKDELFVEGGRRFRLCCEAVDRGNFRECTVQTLAHLACHAAFNEDFVKFAPTYQDDANG